MSEFYDDSSKNMRDDMKRGVDPEALADMGYEVPGHMLKGEYGVQGSPTTPEAQQEQRVETAAQNAGDVICGDCLHIVPCAHVGVRPDGSRYTRGY